MRRESIPNILTASRLALVPVLWILALAGESRILAAGLALAGTTDALDGYLARRMNATSAAGSRFDSIADQTLFASTLAWILLLRPEFVREQLPVLLVWLGLGAVSLIVGWVRFRRFADLHLYSAKVAVVAGLAFAVYLLAVGSYDVWIFRAVALIAFIAILETIIVQLTFEEVDEHIGSVFTIRRRSPVR